MSRLPRDSTPLPTGSREPTPMPSDSAWERFIKPWTIFSPYDVISPRNKLRDHLNPENAVGSLVYEPSPKRRWFSGITEKITAHDMHSLGAYTVTKWKLEIELFEPGALLDDLPFAVLSANFRLIKESRTPFKNFMVAQVDKDYQPIPGQRFLFFDNVDELISSALKAELNFSSHTDDGGLLGVDKIAKIQKEYKFAPEPETEDEDGKPIEKVIRPVDDYCENAAYFFLKTALQLV